MARSESTSAFSGEAAVAWAGSRMPVLAGVRERFRRELPLAGIRLGACLHVTAETAVLLETLAAGGAELALAASNPLSTNDDVAALLRSQGVRVHAKQGESAAELEENLDAVIDFKPAVTVDDGCDLIARLHVARQDAMTDVLGGTEDTATGALRLRTLSEAGLLAYPVVAIGGATTRLLADNQHGVAQSTLAAIVRSTNTLLAGATVVVAGYGNCGKAIADGARGLGASVVVTEVDPLRALAALLDGYRVAAMADACSIGEVFVTATGNRDVLTEEHFASMRDGAVLANAGQFDVEIDLAALSRKAGPPRRVRPMVDEYTLADRHGQRRLLVLAEGRIVNLAAAEGSPPQVMDLAFSVQALACEWLVARKGELVPAVYDLPADIDLAVARLKLEALGVSLDALSDAQVAYLASWGR